jgi:histidinol-phosphate aminotransferase
MYPEPTELVKNMTPYIPGEQPQDGVYIKLNTNENPYPPSPEVIEAIKKVDVASLKKYPDPLFKELRTLIAEKNGVSIDEVFVGNGSDEVLRVLFQAYLSPGDKLAVTDPTYSLYTVIADMLGAKTVEFDLGPEGEIPDFGDLSDFRVIAIPNPNPPLGIFYEEEELAKIAASSPSTLFIIDEAYIDFAEKDSIPLIKKFRNCIITRTFSKSSALAGIRVGYSIGQKHITDNLYKIKDSYNVNCISQAAAIAAMRSCEYYKKTAELIKKDRAYLAENLRDMGFKVYKSSGNFVFAECDNGKEIYEKLKEKKILVRYFNAPRLKNGVRISVGTREEIGTLLQVIKKIIA